MKILNRHGSLRLLACMIMTLFLSIEASRAHRESAARSAQAAVAHSLDGDSQSGGGAILYVWRAPANRVTTFRLPHSFSIPILPMH